MTQRRGTRASLAKVMAAAVVTVVPIGSVDKAGAENFFDFLFGTLRRMATPTPPDNNDRYALPGPEHPEGGPPLAFCVRLCDGYNFPIAHRTVRRNVSRKPDQHLPGQRDRRCLLGRGYPVWRSSQRVCVSPASRA